MGIDKIAEADFHAAVEQSEQPVVVDFFATWCGPCRVIAPILDELSTAFEGQVKFVKVDIDEAPGVAEKFAITGVPTLLVVKNGEEADRKVGAHPKPALEAWVANHVRQPG
jgi:thioredoxin 1